MRGIREEGGGAMSMLSEQVKELREAARNVQGNLGRCLYRRKDVDEMQQVSGMLFEAADTIESLRDRLQESYEQVPELVKRESEGERESCGPLDVLLRCLENDYGIKASWDGLRKLWLTENVTSELDYIEDKTRWFELFGTPERTAQLIADNCEFLSYCGQCWMRAANCDGNYSTVLEWLRGDA